MSALAQIPIAPVSPVADLLPAGEVAVNDIVLSLRDASLFARYGCKGPAAAQWLANQGYPIPPQPNQLAALPQGGRILRLGVTEFLVETDAAAVAALYAAPRVPGLYPVLRQDACFVLRGAQLPSLLLQTCNVNFAALDLSLSPVVLTSMVGVSVTVLPGNNNGVPCYRVWCDGSYGPYLWQTLLAIAEELGGGAAGVEHPASPT